VCLFGAFTCAARRDSIQRRRLVVGNYFAADTARFGCLTQEGRLSFWGYQDRCILRALQIARRCQNASEEIGVPRLTPFRRGSTASCSARDIIRVDMLNPTRLNRRVRIGDEWTYVHPCCLTKAPNASSTS
jgi:hypothetical protein